MSCNALLSIPSFNMYEFFPPPIPRHPSPKRYMRVIERLLFTAENSILMTQIFPASGHEQIGSIGNYL